MNRILIVDASESDRRLISGLLVKSGYEPIAVEAIEAAKDEVAKLPPGAVIVAAMTFVRGTAQELINWQKTEGYGFPVVAIVDNLNPLDIADVMMDGGAVNIIQRPAMDKQFVETVGRYVRSGRTMLLLPDELIPRQSEAFAVIERAIRNIAATDVNAVIFGECGSGKEQIAKEIYRLSSRSQKPCTVIEAGGAALVGNHDPANLRSEVLNRMEGYFKKADGGTIIIKNVQLLTFEKQSVLFHILEQEHKDVRIICTANASLLKMLADESFRDNLFYILQQSSITVPPLREMTEDIPDITNYLLTRYAQKKQQSRKHLDASAIKALKLHPWPGNIRELKDTVLFAAFHAKEDTVTAADISFDDATPDTAEDLTHRNPRTEKENIIKAFNRAGTWRGAAKLLGISERALFEQRRKHGIGSDGKTES